MKIRLRDFNSGLVLDPPPDQIPDNALCQARGIHAIPRSSVHSRSGSTALHTVNAQAGIHYWNNTWFYGTSNSLYQGSSNISNGTYNGNRLTLFSANPTPYANTEYLFVAGGSTLTLRKVDTSNTVTNWGIDPPPATLNAASGGTTGAMTTGGKYLYRYTYYNQYTGSRSNPTAAPTTDGFSTNVKMLTHFDGAHAATAVASNFPSTVTLGSTGNAALTTANQKFGTACLGSDGSSASYVRMSPWVITFDELKTIDCWIRINQTASSYTYGICGQYRSSSQYWSLLARDDKASIKAIQFHAKSSGTGGGTSITCSVAWNPSSATWYHIAYVNSLGGVAQKRAVFISGAMGTPVTTYSGLHICTGNFTIGAAYDPVTADTVGLLGSIDEFRVSNAPMWHTSFTPSTAAYGSAYIALGADDKAVALTGLTSSTDPQVTHNEIWRTVNGGAYFYLSGRVGASETTYLDQIADNSLGLDELPIDNDKPYTWFDDCIVYNASAFWITRTQTGEKGRLYYSPIGRLEAMEGYIEVTDDSDPLQRLVPYGTAIGVFSQGGFFEITGTNPYYSRRVHGIPGTLEPYSVCEVPGGIAYEAPDGPRFLVGNNTTPLASGKIESIFRGESRGQLTAWSTGTYGTYARDEYFITNVGSTQSLAFNFRTGRWRDLGLPLGPIHYAPTVDKLAAHYTTASAVYEIEKEGETDDSGAAISFSIETKHFSDSASNKILVRSAFVDLDTGTTKTAAVLVSDSTTLALTTISATSRSIYEIPINRWVNNFGLRITGTLSEAIKIHGIDFDVYTPEEVTE